MLLQGGAHVVVYDVNVDLPESQALAELHGGAVSLVSGNVLDFDGLSDLMRDHRIDVVVHLAYVLAGAAAANPRLGTEVNLVGTSNVFEAAVTNGVQRVVYASSISVYGDDARYEPEDLPLHEGAPMLVADGVRLYGASKVYVEALAHTYSLASETTFVALRPSIVYGGTRQSGSVDWISQAVRSAAAGQPVTLARGGAAVSLVHVDDVAAQFAALASCDQQALDGRTTFNSGGDTCTIDEFAEVIGQAFPSVRIDIDPGESRSLLGLAASVDGSAIDHLMGRTRVYSPLPNGLAKFVADLSQVQA